MLLTFEDRETASPYLERVWRSSSHAAGEFLSMAESEWLGIRFRLGTYFPQLAVTGLLDYQGMDLPVLGGGASGCPV